MMDAPHINGPIDPSSEEHELFLERRAAAEVVAERDEVVRRISAAIVRLGDFKAVHSKWYDGSDRRAVEDVIQELESIAYSVRMYLDGQPGPYLKAAGDETG